MYRRVLSTRLDDMAFAYTLIIRLPVTNRIGVDDTELTIDWRGRPVVIKSVSGKSSIRESEWLRFACRDFPDEEGARAHGQSLKGHLRLAAVKSHLPLNVGRDQVHSRAGKSVIDHAAEQGIQILPGVHGLMVYEQTEVDVYMWNSARGVSVVSSDRLLDSLQAVASLGAPPDGSQLALACDLYSQAMFETSQAARFISLVTAIEALVKRGRFSQAIREVLRTAEAAALAELEQMKPLPDASTLNSIRGRFRDLQRESITQAFRRLARTYGNSQGYGDSGTPEEFAASVYSLRSRIVHGESVSDSLPVAHLMVLVSDIILGLAADS
jgi:hypothetical protein